MPLDGQQHIGIGQPNQSQGSDSLYTAFTKIEENFDTVFTGASQYTAFQPAAVPTGSNVGIVVNTTGNTVTFQNSGVTSLTAVGNGVTLSQSTGDIRISVSGGGGNGGGGSLNSVGLISNTNTIVIGDSPLISDGNLYVDLNTIPGITGNYTVPNITVDQFGRVVRVSNGVAGSVLGVNVLGNTANGIAVVTTGNPNINPTFEVINTGVTRIISGGGVIVSGDGTGAVTLTVTGGGGGGGAGTVTRVGLLPGSNNLTVTGVAGGNILTAGTFTVDLSSNIGLNTLGANSIAANNVIINNNINVANTANVGNLNASGSITAAANITSNNLTVLANANVTNTLSANALITNSITSNSLSIANNVTITGNASVAGNLTVTTNSNVAGLFRSSNTTASTSAATGAVTTAGGLGVAGNINTTGSLAATGQVTFSNTATATNTTSGALVVSGGVGVTGNIFLSGQINTATLVASGAANIGGVANIGNTSESFATSSGALVVVGGAGIGANLNVRGNIAANANISTQSNLTVSGNITGSSNANIAGSVVAGANLTSILYTSPSTLAITSPGGPMTINSSGGLLTIQSSTNMTVTAGAGSGNINISGNLNHNAAATTSATFSGNVNIGTTGNSVTGLTINSNGPNSLVVNGNTRILGGASVQGTLGVTGTASFQGATFGASISQAAGAGLSATFPNLLTVGQAGNAVGQLQVAATGANSIYTAGGANIVGAAIIGGNLTVSGNITGAATTTLNLLNTTANNGIAGNLYVTGTELILGPSPIVTNSSREFAFSNDVANTTSGTGEFIILANLGAGTVESHRMGVVTASGDVFQQSNGNLVFQTAGQAGALGNVASVRSSGAFRIVPRAAAPAVPNSLAGDLYFNSGTNRLNYFNGTAWVAFPF